MNPQEGLLQILAAAPVVPVVTVKDPAQGVALARALVAGGLTAIEVTLRTPAALEAIGAIAREVPGAVVGAGTVLSRAQLAAVAAQGARFAVSPGTSPALLAAARESRIPFLPGAATVSEMMALAEGGFTYQKLFPAEAVGGAALLKAVSAPLPQLRFCPTGGIDAARAQAYFDLPNVVCVGGSWVVPAAAIAAGDWKTITDLAAEAADMPRRFTANF